MVAKSKITRFLGFAVVALCVCSTAAMAAEKALVFGTPTANIRGGPGVEHPIKVNLKEGDSVVIEKLEGEWYLVTAADGQKGYIHKNLLKVAEEVQKPAVPPVKTNEGAAKEPVKAEPPAIPAQAPASESAPGRVAPLAKVPAPLDVKTVPAPAKSSALIRLIEGRETETAICLVVALLAFLMGWICGGIYSLRRDRLKRSRLNF